MDIHQYAKLKKASRKFQNWLLKEPQIMLDWAMWADGKSLEEIYTYLTEVYKEENAQSQR